MLNSRMDSVQSPIISVVGEWIRQHPGTISLGQGIAYYAPPPEAFERLPELIQDPGAHTYSPTMGILPLRAAIAAKLQTENRIPADPDQVVVTAGSNMGFMHALLAITDPGDEIIIQTPYYFNHEMGIRIAGCIPIAVATDPSYHLQLAQIEAAITPKTRAIVTISPNNPTGVVYPKVALTEVNALCQRHQLFHIHDETYEYFVYDGSEHFSPASIPGSLDHTISLFSLSKAYGFASWRVGYMVIPSGLQDPIRKIQDTVLICPPLVSQWAALGCLQVGRSYCHEKLKATVQARQIVLETLAEIPDLCQVPASTGAFYVLPKLATTMPALELVERLIRDFQVAVIPGTTFGLEQGCYVRVAYGALLPETAEAGIRRLVAGLKRILAPGSD